MEDVHVMALAITTLTKQSRAVVVIPLSDRLSDFHSFWKTAEISDFQLCQFEFMSSEPPFVGIVGCDNEQATLLLFADDSFDERLSRSVQRNSWFVPQQDFGFRLDGEGDFEP